MSPQTEIHHGSAAELAVYFVYLGVQRVYSALKHFQIAIRKGDHAVAGIQSPGFFRVSQQSVESGLSRVAGVFQSALPLKVLTIKGKFRSKTLTFPDTKRPSVNKAKS
jgi:hypothetical protein